MKKITCFLFQLAAIVMLSIVGTVSANADELTVYDGTELNSFVPYYSEYGDFTQKHEFIIPASQLTAMKGATISKLTFYSSTAHSTPDFTFKIFLKEVDQTTFTDFIGDEGSTTVYSGTMTVADNKVEFAFTEDYQYNGGNLMIGFYTLSVGMYTPLGFYGVTQEEYTAIYGMGQMSGNYENVTTPTVTSNDKFLPKTTFTYEAGAATEATEIANILAYKNFEMTDPTAESEDVALVLTNAKVTYINQEQDAVAIEDESAGYLFEQMGLSTLLEEGQTLNGKLAMTASDAYFGVSFQLTDGINGVTVESGEVAPMVVTEDNASDYANDYDWRLARFEDITVKVEQGNYGAEPSVINPIISDDPLPIYDRFGVMDQNIADGTVGTITGFLASLYGMTIFMPTAFEEKAEEPITEIADIAAFKTFEMSNPDAESEKVVLILNNVKVTQVGKTSDDVVMEDESAGWIFQNLGLKDLVEEGQILNGRLEMTASPGWYGVEFTLTNGLEGVTAEEGDITPIEVNSDNIDTYANDYDWRYAKIADVTLKGYTDEWGKYYTMTSDLLGGDDIMIFDRFFTMSEDFEDGTIGTITGFLASVYGMTIFYVTNFEAEENAISNVNTTSENGKTAIYNLRGQLLSAPTRGINIINGKKVVVK